MIREPLIINRGKPSILLNFDHPLIHLLEMGSIFFIGIVVAVLNTEIQMVDVNQLNSFVFILLVIVLILFSLLTVGHFFGFAKGVQKVYIFDRKGIRYYLKWNKALKLLILWPNVKEIEYKKIWPSGHRRIVLHYEDIDNKKLKKCQLFEQPHTRMHVKEFKAIQNLHLKYKLSTVNVHQSNKLRALKEDIRILERI
ncbi:MAG: hypothetical protein ACXAC7_21075 [Candidatus Hodarchaeales archaeon]|jgi:hypothetical protein